MRLHAHRWDSASHAGASWAGHELPAVQIERFGRFTYVLVKLSDRTAGSKLLVRGKNGRSEAQLVSAITNEARAPGHLGKISAGLKPLHCSPFGLPSLTGGWGARYLLGCPHM